MIRHRCSQVFVITVLTLLFALSSCSISEQANSMNPDHTRSILKSTQERAEYIDNLELSTSRSDDYVTVYQDFLQGKCAAKLEDKYMYLTEMNYSTDAVSSYQYALFDMNCDDIPELHILVYNYYYILTYIESELSVWHFTVSNYLPTDDHALLYTRVGAAPPYITYQYRTLDFWGDTVLHIYFDKYDVNYDGIYDEQDDYFYNDVGVTKAEWDVLTEPYISSTSDLIQWINVKEED